MWRFGQLMLEHNGHVGETVKVQDCRGVGAGGHAAFQEHRQASALRCRTVM